MNLLMIVVLQYGSNGIGQIYLIRVLIINKDGTVYDGKLLKVQPKKKQIFSDFCTNFARKSLFSRANLRHYQSN